VARSSREGGGGSPRPGPPGDVPRPRNHYGAPNTPKDATGTEKARLEALRARLEAVLDDPSTSPRDLAAVSREYRMTIAKLAEMAPAEAGSALDEIARRRKKRGA
jgi:hypothetical protein